MVDAGKIDLAVHQMGKRRGRARKSIHYVAMITDVILGPGFRQRPFNAAFMSKPSEVPQPEGLRGPLRIRRSPGAPYIPGVSTVYSNRV